MLVNTQTFEPMMDSAREVEMFGAKVMIPSVEHLLALKIHALKYTRAHRFLKDFMDVEGMIRISGLDPRSEKVRQLFLKYGTLDLYEKTVRACSDK